MSISRGKIAWAPLAVGSARKPNFVSAVQAVAIIHLGRPLPNGSSGLPENDVGLHRTRNRAGSFRFPIWPCTARSLPGRMCYHTRRWALTSPFHPLPLERGWFVLCCTCRHPLFTGARMLSGSLPFGVRTFLSSFEKRPPALPTTWL